MATGWDRTTRPGPRRFPTRVARAILARDTTCRLGLPGCTIDSTEADHITGWAQAQAQGWSRAQFDDPENGQGVCAPCHQVKTLGQATAGRAAARARKPRARPKPKHPGLK